MITTAALQCEYTTNPLGVDVAHPRLSWVLHAPERGQSQTAVQILAASTPDLLAEDSADLWDSGKILSSHNMLGYAGYPLNSRQRCYWKVRVWDQKDQAGPYSTPAWFEMGLLRPSSWKAQWISGPDGQSSAAFYFYRQFTVSGDLHRARAYFCGIGGSALFLNGTLVNQPALDQEPTEVSHKIFYRALDVGPFLRSGANSLCVVLANGWLEEKKLLLQMEVEYQDGRTELICSEGGPSWQVSTGPILRSGLFTGETYDARLRIPGWPFTAEPGPASGWFTPTVVPGPQGKRVAQIAPQIQDLALLAPQTRRQLRPNVFLYDFGQTIRGWAEITVSGPQGSRIVLQYAQTLREDGTGQANETEASFDEYILNDQPLQTWEPQFAVHHFRYLLVEDRSGHADLQSVKAHRDTPEGQPISQFWCSSPRLQHIHKQTVEVERSFLYRFPIPGAPPDTRLRWLKEMFIRAETGLFNIAFQHRFSAWVGDIADQQDPVSAAVTHHGPASQASPIELAYLLIPWQLFIHHGDGQTLANHYRSMRKWVDALVQRAAPSLIEDPLTADWDTPAGNELSPDEEKERQTLIATALYHRAHWLIYEFAGVIGNMVDKEAYVTVADEIAEAFNQRFWNEARGGYSPNDQTSNALALYFDMVPDERKERVVAALRRNLLEQHNGRLTTGALGTYGLLDVLSEAGQAEAAFSAVTQTDFQTPSQLEAVDAWMIKTVAGVNPDLHFPAYEQFFFRPRLTHQLTAASFTIQTRRGPISAAWQRTEVGLSMAVTVPVGSRARVSVPKPHPAARFTIEEAGQVIWSGEARMPLPPGFLDSGEEQDFVTFTVGAGSYLFHRKA